MIQQNINQIISLTGLLASQTPYAKARAEEVAKKRAATAEYKKAKTEFDQVNEEINKQVQEMKLDWTEHSELWEEAGQRERQNIINRYELRYKTNPTEIVDTAWGDVAERLDRQGYYDEADEEVATEETPKTPETPVETAAAPMESPKKQPSPALRKIQEPLNRLIEEQAALRAARDPYSGKINARPYGGQIVYRR